MIQKNYSELFEFTATQLATLKRAYMPLKGKTLTMPQINKLQAMLIAKAVFPIPGLPAIINKSPF